MPLAQCSDTMGTATRTTSRFQVAVFLYQYYVHRLDYRRPHFRCAHVVPFHAHHPLERRWCSLASARSLACTRPMRVSRVRPGESPRAAAAPTVCRLGRFLGHLGGVVLSLSHHKWIGCLELYTPI